MMKQIPSHFDETLMKLDDLQLEILRATFDCVWGFATDENIASEKGKAACKMRREIHAEIARREVSLQEPPPANEGAHLEA